SLAVEEHFYLLLALFLGLLAWRRANEPFSLVRRAFFVIAPLALTLRILSVALWVPYQYEHHLFPTHLRIDGLALGVVLSYVMHFRREALLSFVARRHLLLWTCAFLGIAPAAALTIERNVYLQTFGLTGLYLGFGAVLLLSLGR